MAILETAITLQGDPLVEKAFYSTADVLDKNIRNALLQAITGLAQEAFNDAIQSFSLGEYSIVLIMHDITQPGNPTNKLPIMMYCIVEKNTDEKAIKQCMKDTIDQFLDRYSLNDIFDKKLKKFKDFSDRLSKIFKDLILKSEDRFKSLF